MVARFRTQRLPDGVQEPTRESCPNPRYIPATGNQQSARLLDHKPQSQLRLQITPEAFFCLVEDQFRAKDIDLDRQGARLRSFGESIAFSTNSYERLLPRFCQQEPLDRVWIKLGIETLTDPLETGATYTAAEVRGHEGRHRAFTSHVLGIDALPAIISVQLKTGGDVPGPDTFTAVNINPDRPNTRSSQPMLTRDQIGKLRLTLSACRIPPRRYAGQVIPQEDHPQADPQRTPTIPFKQTA